MARGSSDTKKELLEKQFRGYLSKHNEARGAGAEVYEFNIKMRRFNIPNIVYQLEDQDAIEDTVATEQEERLSAFGDELADAYPWISKWGVAGRSGGWLVVGSDEPVLDDHGKIPDGEDESSESRRIKLARANIATAEKRLDDLIEIENLLKEAKRKLVKDFSSMDWWGLGPHDWTPRAKPKMSGLFDFLKKKPSEQQDLIHLEPVEVIPGGGLIPAGPPEAFANPFELLAPPAPARGVVPFKPTGPEAMFDVLAPSAPARAAAPAEPVWEEPPAPRAPPRGSRAGGTWRLPTSEELAGHLRSMLDLPRVFSQIRSARKAPEFRRNVDRWAAQGLPALIPVTPVAAGELAEGFARFFGIPSSVLDAYLRQGDEAVWSGLFWPLFDLLSEAFEIEKPGDLPGWFALEHDPDTDEWWLVYLEAE